MKKRVLIIGAYGNFGRHITKKLSSVPLLSLIVAGRSEEKCRVLAHQYQCEYAVLDIHDNLFVSLEKIKPDIVIHTSGPFQGQGYGVAETCIEYGCHYIDLADGREFVSGISALNEKAKAKGVTVISGASSVPTLTSAVIDHYLPQFKKLTAVDYGITTAQRTNTGLATTQAVFGYAGKPFKTLVKGQPRNIYGWQDTVLRKYPGLGWRLLGNCDVPDLTLFPARYKDLDTIRFRAGSEIALIHLGVWMFSWLVRFKIIENLGRYARQLLHFSRSFDALGTNNSGFHMEMSGEGIHGEKKISRFYLIARDGDGPFIPSIPSILCATLLAGNDITQAGAFPCIGIISLEQYLNAMREMSIKIVAD